MRCFISLASLLAALKVRQDMISCGTFSLGHISAVMSIPVSNRLDIASEVGHALGFEAEKCRATTACLLMCLDNIHFSDVALMHVRTDLQSKRSVPAICTSPKPPMQNSKRPCLQETVMWRARFPWRPDAGLPKGPEYVHAYQGGFMQGLVYGLPGDMVGVASSSVVWLWPVMHVLSCVNHSESEFPGGGVGRCVFGLGTHQEGKLMCSPQQGRVLSMLYYGDVNENAAMQPQGLSRFIHTRANMSKAIVQDDLDHRLVMKI